MKTIIAIISGILIFCLGFWLDSQLINWIVSSFQDPHSDLATVVKIGLWVVTFGFTLWISIICAVLVTTFVANILN